MTATAFRQSSLGVIHIMFKILPCGDELLSGARQTNDEGYNREILTQSVSLVGPDCRVNSPALSGIVR